jgi:hypothetical protein
MRPLFALMVVLSVSGLLPLAADIRSCEIPCCRAHASEATIASPSCCNETSCAPALPDAQATTEIAKSLTRPAQVALPSIAPSLACTVAPVAEPIPPGSPPAQQRRLAALSILLV